MSEPSKLPAGVAPISAAEARELIRHTSGQPFWDLLARANAVREAVFGKDVALCAITNAKAGRCAEDCSFCAQSAHYPETGSPEYPMITGAEMAEHARQAEAAGAREFSVVASGTRVSREQDLRNLEEGLRLMAESTSVMRCASLGLMAKEHLARLKAAGLQSFHHNLESARSFYPNVCTTHTWDESYDAIRAAKELGLWTCCGGILGLGETVEQRVELGLALQELGVDSVPVNFLNPRPGTPLASVRAITPEECLAVVAVYRLLMPAAQIFVMGGREVQLGDMQQWIFFAGATGTMIGHYLTSAGRPPDEVVDMIRGQGLDVKGPADEKVHWAFTGEAPRGDATWNRRALASKAAKRALPVVP